jgi:predicted phosphoribosyltransferase
MIFANRCEAGRRLAALLAPIRAREPVVLGLPRGGVPVAYEVAHGLGAPLDVLPVRKLRAPGQPELAIGAVAPGVVIRDHDLIAALGIPAARVVEAREEETARLFEMDAELRGSRPLPDLRGRAVILVDDGIATGATAVAASECARLRGAGWIAIAAPVCAPEAVPKLLAAADDVRYVEAPADFAAVGSWYADFAPTTDAEVRQVLKRADLERQARFRPS